MAERPKAHDWKSCVPRKGTEGSNPSLCARKIGKNDKFLPVFCYFTGCFKSMTPNCPQLKAFPTKNI